MSETITEHEADGESAVEPAAEAVSDDQLIGMLVDRARSEGLQLTGEGGLLQQLTKRVLEGALNGEITDHLGYHKHDAQERNSGNSRNGSRTKTVLTDVGPFEVKVPPRRGRHLRGDVPPRTWSPTSWTGPTPATPGTDTASRC